MKVLHINTNDISGGAARAAYRLHSGLIQIKINSSMFVLNKNTDDPNVKIFKPQPIILNLSDRIYRYIWRHFEFFQRRFGFKPSPLDFEYYLAYRPNGFELFSDCRNPEKTIVNNQLPPFDIINLHWISGFIDYQTFFPYATKYSPIVWTLHDMNAFTGGCHYDLGCDRYNEGCGMCPQLGSREENDLSRFIWNFKQSIYSQISPDRLHIVTPSQWLYKECQQSALMKKFPTTVISNGLDLEVFSPRNRKFSRELLDIPHNTKVILFISEKITTKRKGFALFLDSLSDFEEKSGLFLLTLGSGNVPLKNKIPHLHLGQVHNERFQSAVYSAADLLVIPSMQDNLPNTAMESISCGTPVVGFNVGGLPDMVQSEITGILVPPGDYRAMIDGIVTLLNDEKRCNSMSDNCRRICIDKYDITLQADRYNALYNEMLS